MNLLTDDEIKTAYIEAANQTLRPQDERIALAFAHAIIAATLDKLAAGVSVETPYIYTEWISPGERVSRDMFNRDQLNAAIAAARVQALEEAAVAADLFCNGGESQRPLKYPVADAIRALIGKEST
jgi:hypothetical protein